jgi:hypothetical protein
MKSKFLRVFFVLSIISACNTIREDNHPPEIQSLTPTLLPLYTSTSLPSPISIEPSATPASTLIPTLLPKDKVVEVERLQKTNGGCQWPCWWGITPGITTWIEASNLLQSLTIGITSITKMEHIVYSAAFLMQDTSKLLVDFYVQPQNNVIEVIYLGQELSIIDFLKLEGEPDEIWFFSDGNVPTGSPFMKIILFYPSKGILVSYWGEGRSVTHSGANYLVVCADEFYKFGPAWLFAPNSRESLGDLPLDDISTGLDRSNNYGFERLERYTNMREGDFYKGVLSNLTTTCLETPIDIWPNPDLYTTPTP